MTLLHFKENINDKTIIDVYKKFGFCIIENFFEKKIIRNIKRELNLKTKNKNNKFLYYEQINNKKKLRRIEKVSNFSSNCMKILNSKKIFEFLHKLENKKFGLFKDKLNFKYPGGAGYLPHFDGHFIWKDKNNYNQKGWHKYSNNFISLVIPLEKTFKKNGCLYIAKKLKNNFKQIIAKLEKENFTIKKNYLKRMKFYPIELNEGDVCFFNWKCAHFSKKNNSKNSRMIFYSTYYRKNNQSNIRRKYYIDKKNSKNTNQKKSLLYK